MTATHQTPAILDLLRRRTNTRALDPTPIGDEDVHALLESARWAPSWGNLQPWRIVAVREASRLEAVRAALTRGNRWAARAPALIVVAADPLDAKQRGGESSYAFDCGLATECLLLEAARRSLVAHPMGGWDEGAVRAAIEAPEGVRILVVVAVGRPGDVDALDERSRQEEAGPRRRKALAEIAFAERWGQPLPFATEAAAHE